MAKKRKNNVSYNPIGSINEDWGLDERNGFPYSGESVQRFIKESLNGKAGLFYYDTTNNRYLVFFLCRNTLAFTLWLSRRDCAFCLLQS